MDKSVHAKLGWAELPKPDTLLFSCRNFPLLGFIALSLNYISSKIYYDGKLAVAARQESSSPQKR